jgi:hypothetical protein
MLDELALVVGELHSLLLHLKGLFRQHDFQCLGAVIQYTARNSGEFMLRNLPSRVIAILKNLLFPFVESSFILKVLLFNIGGLFMQLSHTVYLIADVFEECVEILL